MCERVIGDKWGIGRFKKLKDGWWRSEKVLGIVIGSGGRRY